VPVPTDYQAVSGDDTHVFICQRFVDPTDRVHMWGAPVEDGLIYVAGRHVRLRWNPGASVPHRHFPDISPVAWEHPSDATALAVLRAIPGLDRAIGATLGRANELAGGWRLLRNSVPATVEQHPKALRVWREVGTALDAPELPPLHIRKMGGINAATTGMDRPVVLVSEEAVEQLHDGSLRAVLAHELAHILSGHVRYKTAWMFVASLGATSLPAVWTIPFYAGAFAAFRAWDRASELSADRAALLVTGDVDMLAAPIMGHDDTPPSRHLASWRDRLPFTRAMEPILDGGWRAYRSHPLSKDRINALREWEQTDDYAAIVDGHYPRRGDERQQAGRWLEARAAVLKEGLSAAFHRTT